LQILPSVDARTRIEYENLFAIVDAPLVKD